MVAGSHLSSHDTCLIADMGGTNTDAAVLHEGQLEITTDGATVEGNKTMVESSRVESSRVESGLTASAETVRSESTHLVIKPD